MFGRGFRLAADTIRWVVMMMMMVVWCGGGDDDVPKVLGTYPQEETGQG